MLVCVNDEQPAHVITASLNRNEARHTVTVQSWRPDIGIRLLKEEKMTEGLDYMIHVVIEYKIEPIWMPKMMLCKKMFNK